MPKRMFAVSLLILAFACAVPGGRALAAKVFLNTPEARYHVEDGIIYRYELVDAEEIQKDKATVFAAPDGFRIIAFDVARARGVPGRPRQWAGTAKAGTGAGDSTLLAVILDNGKVRLLCIYNETEEGIWFYKDMTAYQPWKVLFADVDGDGALDLCLGVWKESPLHPVLAKRLFIYHLTPGLPPKWRGSRLSKPMTDFYFFHNGEKTHLVSTELTRDGRESVNVYYWDQFGFTGYGEYYPLREGEAVGEGYLRKNGELQKSLLITDNGQPSGGLPKNLWKGFINDEEEFINDGGE